jgi:bifunctional non-homologous end joining protein LigD
VDNLQQSKKFRFWNNGFYLHKTNRLRFSVGTGGAARLFPLSIFSPVRPGEAVVLGVDGVADFDALHSGRHNDEVQLYAFDCLALDGDDLRRLPLSMRKMNLARLLARRPDGIFVAPFEQGEIGPELFRAACRMGLEGLVSKRRDRPYQAGRSKYSGRIRR